MKLIFRNFYTTLRRYKLASILNLLGLSIAFAAFVVIAIQVRYELTFDKDHPNAERIYRLNQHSQADNQYANIFLVPSDVFSVFKNISPDVENFCLYAPVWGKSYFVVEEENGKKTGYNEPMPMATTEFVDVFGLEFIDGANTLDKPGNIIVPQSIAEKLFGTWQAVGQEIKSEGSIYTVGGVFKDLPENSQIKNSIIRHFAEQLLKPTNWNQQNYIAYLKLKEGASAEKVEADFAKHEIKNNFMGQLTLSLIALEDIYLSQMQFYADDSLATKGNPTTIKILISIALLIIVIAVINFINFSTSLAPIRIKGINTQKVMGCQTSVLRGSLIGEAVGLSVVAFALGLFWVYGLQDSSLRTLISAGVKFSGNWDIIGATGVIVIIIGVIAGIYPALYITKFPPALVLKGSFGLSPKGRAMRSVLIGVQFTVSIGLIIAALFLQKQNNYMRSIDTGVDKERIAMVEIGGNLLQNRDAFDNNLKQSSQIDDVAYAGFKLGNDNMTEGWYRKLNDKDCFFSAFMVTWNFLRVMGIEVVEGRDFEQTDTQREDVVCNFILNEKALTEFEIKIPFKHIENQEQGIYTDFIGVTKNFNFKTLQYGIEPFVFVVAGAKGHKPYMPNAFIRYTGDANTVITQIQEAARKVDPFYPVTVSLADEAFNTSYQSEVKAANLISIASVLSVLLSLMGVFGIVVFEVQYRRKEIAVRKVYGSTTSQILVRLNSKFVYILAICTAIAIPTAWLLVDLWLKGFAYRTQMSWWIFAAGTLVVATITIAVVTLQSWKTANENPAKNVKAE